MPANKNSTDDKVFDVAKPGKTAANSTSKPVIIGHKSMLKDPMVKDEGSVDLIAGTNVSQKIDVNQDDKASGSPVPEPADSEPGTAPTVTRLKIGPISDSVGTKKAEPVSDKPAKKSIKLQISSNDQSTPQKESTPEEPAKTPETAIKDSVPDEPEEEQTKTDDTKSQPADQAKPEANDTQNNDSKTDDSAAVAAVADQAEAQKKPDKEAEEEAARLAAAEKLIVDKKYFVPVGQKTRKKRSLQNILLGVVLIIVLSALLADVLLDAGLVHYKNIQAPIKIINR